MFLLLLHLVLAAPAQAEPAVAAESIRISHELRSLAQRGAWSGVERAYRALLELGAEPDARTHQRAAQAARHRGDLAAARERLWAASRSEDAKDILDALFALDSRYGRVEIIGHRLSIVPVRASVLPVDQAAVAHANQALEDAGRFEGLLPPGQYIIGGRPVTVDAGERVSLALGPATQRRKLRLSPRS